MKFKGKKKFFFFLGIFSSQHFYRIFLKTIWIIFFLCVFGSWNGDYLVSVSSIKVCLGFERVGIL